MDYYYLLHRAVLALKEIKLIKDAISDPQETSASALMWNVGTGACDGSLAPGRLPGECLVGGGARSREWGGGEWKGEFQEPLSSLQHQGSKPIARATFPSLPLSLHPPLP